VDGRDHRALALNRQSQREREGSALRVMVVDGDVMCGTPSRCGREQRRRGYNPVRGIKSLPGRRPTNQRAVDFDDIERLLAVITVRPIISPSPLRLCCSHPAGVLAKLEAGHVDFRTGMLQLPRSLKGTASKAASTPRCQALGSR